MRVSARGTRIGYWRSGRRSFGSHAPGSARDMEEDVAMMQVSKSLNATLALSAASIGLAASARHSFCRDA